MGGALPKCRVGTAALAHEQAALRRVATLVARGVPAQKVFTAVAEELALLLDAGITEILRYEPDGTVTVVGGWSLPDLGIPIGTRLTLEGTGAVASVRETGRPSRAERFAGPPGSLPGSFQRLGARTGVGSPVVVDGVLWGVAVAAFTRDEPLAADSEAQVSRFTELVAAAIANAHGQTELRRVGDEQAALRRVATLVASGTSPEKVFSAVAEEVGKLLMEADVTLVGRYDSGAVELLAGWTSGGDTSFVGRRVSLGGDNVPTLVFERNAPARVDRFVDDASTAAALAVEGARSAAGTPVVVQGRLWGVMTVGSMREQGLPADIEERLAEFVELVATAISNAEAREALRAIAEEQAALRRVATLVAHGTAPADVFSAVTREVRSVFGADGAIIVRAEPDDAATIVAHAGAHAAELPVGSRRKLDLPLATPRAVQTRRPSRIDSFSDVAGGLAEVMRAAGIRSSVARPIVVQGRVWGAIAIGTENEAFPTSTEQRMVGFTELLATAIANAEAHTELTASRARIVASADEARRRIERALHDGAQQRLVSLALQVRSAQASLPPGLDGIAAELDRVAGGLTDALDELRELARGIHPASLAEGGLQPALKALTRRSLVPVRLDVRTRDRLPETVEVGAYYVVSEALANAAKHAHASYVAVEAEAGDRLLRVAVRDDGVGGAELTRGGGLVGIKDRVEALGGRIALQSESGAGTTISIELPLASGTTALASD